MGFRKMHVRRIVACRAMVFVAMWTLGSGVAFAQVCNAPNDGVTPADAAINACFNNNGSVFLPGGTYLITATIQAFNPNTANGSEFASVPGQLATLVASTSLNDDIVHAGNGANGFKVHDLHLNGSLDQGRNCLSFPPNKGYNLSANGSNWQVYNLESGNSPCANMVVGGNHFLVTNVYLWHSGTSHCGPSCGGGPVGDGLDVEPGIGGEITNVTIDDATDIGLVAGGGNRWIHNVHINNRNHRGFAGFNVGNFNSGNHAGAVYEDIHVTSDYNMLNMGILLGAHPWSTSPVDDVSNAGTVRNNSATGAVINLVVDGIANIEQMHGNTYPNPQGGDFVAPGCSGYGYTAWHFGGSIQPGWQGLQYDLGVFGEPCVPQG